MRRQVCAPISAVVLTLTLWFRQFRNMISVVDVWVYQSMCRGCQNTATCTSRRYLSFWNYSECHVAGIVSAGSSSRLHQSTSMPSLISLAVTFKKSHLLVQLERQRPSSPLLSPCPSCCIVLLCQELSRHLKLVQLPLQDLCHWHPSRDALMRYLLILIHVSWHSLNNLKMSISTHPVPRCRPPMSVRRTQAN